MSPEVTQSKVKQSQGKWLNLVKTHDMVYSDLRHCTDDEPCHTTRIRNKEEIKMLKSEWSFEI